MVMTWEERVIVPERGSRIVHFIINDSLGNSVLAVVGRERCLNHMVYMILEDFLRIFGSTSTIRAGKKWQARRDAVEWLASVVAKGGPVLANSISCQSNNTQTTADVERSASEEPALQASKRVKRCRLSQILGSNNTGLTDLKSDNHVVKWEPTCNQVRIKLPSKRPLVNGLPVSERPMKVFPKLNQNIELLSQDSGLQGCWFRCKILLSSKDCLKVQYKDIFQVDGAGKLEEWIPACRMAAPDKLGVRCVGRLTIRPQPCVDSSDTTFVLGAAVDVWWYNGWWEGVVLGCEALTNTNLQVYFPGENRFSTVARENIRVSRDWIDRKWVNIKARDDILSFLSSVFSPGPKLTTQSVFTEANGSATNSKVPSPHKLEEPKVDKLKIPSSTASTSLKAVEKLSFKKRLMIRYNEEIG